MGTVHAEVELINGVDFSDARRHVIGEDEIKSTRVRMLVDSGSYLMAINENIQAYLNLPFQYKEPAVLADGRVVRCDVVGPIEVRFANRRATCNAFVLPEDSEPLLGAIPMEEMDVVIDMKRQELAVNPLHPDGQSHRI
jgi:clan AA aspartic protease